MPHTRSAAKRHRQSEDRRIRNKDRLTELKSIKKRIVRAVHDGQKAEAETLYREVTKALDQAASRKTIHKNAASRTKARLAKAISATTAPVAKTGIKPVKAVKQAPAPKAAVKAAPKASAKK
jgi:small subunit ribosomal protein S20